MKHRWMTATAVPLSLLAPAAMADSQAAFPDNRAGVSPSHIEGSGQGGYLGQDPRPIERSQMGAVPGTRLPSAMPADEAMVWCRNSPEPSRCRARSGAEHQICAGKSPESYAHCRRAMDQMYSR